MLKKIILENFMSHARTEIELADGLTVLTGPNNCGKSAVVAALHILATNGRTSHVMRHGEKLCRVTVETDDGHTVTWERKKSTVKYTLNGVDVNRVGNSTPETLHDLLRLDRVQAGTGKGTHDYDIHFGEQKSPIFLLGETGSRAASFFASSSDASRLVEMQHRHRSNVRERKSDAKRLTAEKEKNVKRLKVYEPLDQITRLVANAEGARKAIDSLQTQMTKLRELTGFLVRKSEARDRLGRQQQALARIEQTATTPTLLQRESDRQKHLANITTQLSSLTVQQQSLYKQNETLEKLAPPTRQHDVDRLRKRIADLTRLQQHQQKARRILDCCERLESPPPMEAAGQCGKTVDAILKATKREEHAAHCGKVLSDLRRVPDLYDTQRPRSLMRRLAAAIKSEARSKEAKQAFASLTKPPQLNAVNSMRQTIVKLSEYQAKIREASTAKQALERLHSPSDPNDLAPLKLKINQLISLTQSAAAAKQRSESAKEDVGQCERTVRAFVELNPTCETCGGCIDPETLLSSLPEGHCHSGKETTRGK